MSKKLPALIVTLFITVVTHAQQYTVSDLVGRWRCQSHLNVYNGDLLFLSESTGAFTSPKGLLYAHINYSTVIKKDIIRIKYTVDIGRKKNPNYIDMEIRFLDDSTFLFGRSITHNADTSTKQLRVYKKIKIEAPGTEPRIPNYNDLIGEWADFFNGVKGNPQLIFMDKDHVKFNYGNGLAELTYKVDFTKQPMPIDFYISSVEILQGYLMFSGENLLRIEFFKGNRKDHFTMLGRNMVFVRADSNN